MRIIGVRIRPVLTVVERWYGVLSVRYTHQRAVKSMAHASVHNEM